jgi:ketosteroid isomerase-like protein
MKYIIAALLLVSTACSGTSPRTTARPSRVADEVRRAEEDWNAAIDRRDVRTMERFLAPGYFLAIGVEGQPLQIVPRETWLRNLELYDIQSYSIDDMRVNIYQNTAVVTMLFTQQAVVGPQRRDRSAQFFITDIWIRDDDRWKVAERHSSRPERPAAR